MSQTQTYAIAPHFAVPHALCPISPWEAAQAELNAYIQEQANEVAPEIEVDSEIGVASPIYRVW